MTHIFISHAHKDYDDFVARLVNDLQQIDEIEVWIDRVKLKPGMPNWEQTLRDAIENASAVLLIASENSRKSLVVSDEIAVARLYEVPIYPVWAKGKHWINCIRLGYGSVQYIDARNEKYAQGLQTIINTLTGKIAMEPMPNLDATGEPETVTTIEPINPYKGLEAFQEADRIFFFGREALIEVLVARIQQIAQSDSRLLAIVGASGSGKSSVVMAGMIPKLREQTDWLILDPLRPGTKPVRSLARRLNPCLPNQSMDQIVETLGKQSAEGLDFLGHDAIAGSDHSNVLLYIDQFEETFTHVVDEQERQQFINLLATAATEPQGTVIVVFSLRADFYDRPMNYESLGRLIEVNNKSVLAMSLSELTSAVMRPAHLVGLQFEPGLAAEIVFALRGKSGALAGALPLLQFALERLYEKRDGNTLTLAAYEEIGRIEGAIGSHAETVFSDLDEDAQAALEQVFLALVNVDEGGIPTRNRAILNEVITDEATETLVDALVRNRLLLTGRDTIDSEESPAYLEIAHEALLQSWPRMVEWIDIISDDLRLRDQFIRAAQEWDNTNRPDHLLWPHEHLIPVYEMLKRLDFDPDETTAAFIQPEWERLLEEFKALDESEVIPDKQERRLLSIIDRWEDLGEAAGPIVVKVWAERTSPYSAKTKRLQSFIYNPLNRDFVVPLVRSLVNDDSAYKSEKAVYTLGQLDDDMAVPVLIEVLKDKNKDWRVRKRASQVLGNLGDIKAVPELIAALQDEYEEVRRHAAQALGSLGDVKAVPELIATLKDEDEEVRRYAAQALGSLGDVIAVPELIATLKDENNWVRQRVAEALGRLGDKRGVSALIDAVIDNDQNVRLTATRALSGFGGDVHVLSIHIAALYDDDTDVRITAVRSLRELGDVRAVPILIDMLGDDDSKLRMNAIWALKEFGDVRAVSALILLLSDRSVPFPLRGHATGHGRCCCRRLRNNWHGGSIGCGGRGTEEGIDTMRKINPRPDNARGGRRGPGWLPGARHRGCARRACRLPR